MAKNEKFSKTYIVTVQGTSTNGFMPKLIEDMLYAIILSVNLNYKQTKAVIKEIK